MLRCWVGGLGTLCLYPTGTGLRGRPSSEPNHHMLLPLTCARQVEGNAPFQLQCPSETTADHPAPLPVLVSSGGWTSGGVCVLLAAASSLLRPTRQPSFQEILGLLVLSLLFLTFWVVVHLALSTFYIIF